MSHRSPAFDEADLHSFVDGQMPLARRSSFLQAMAADPEMRARVESWKRQNQALSATFGPILAERVPLRLLPTSLARQGQPRLATGPKIRSEDQRGSSSDERQLPSVRSRVLAAALAAFMAGAICSYAAAEFGWGLGLVAGTHTVEVAASPDHRTLALRAYEAHQTYVTDLNHPVEVPASDQAHLLKWIQHRLAMPVRIPDLGPQGWSLLGGRVLPGEVGPAAFLIYGNGVERLGLYIARTHTHQSETYRVYDNGAGLASVAYWIDEPVGYALTTSRDASWFDRNGPALYRSVRAQARDNASAF